MMKTLSFCITCKNRIHQIRQTLRKNLDDNLCHKEFIDFILVDFSSADGLREWITSNFQQELMSGYLKYYYTEALPHWHASVAKNTSHLCATGDILVNLDCDNFTGIWGGAFVINAFDRYNDWCVFHQYSGNQPDGSYGRIAVKRSYFDRIGGYNEDLEPMSYQDNDLIMRLTRLGLKYVLSADSEYNQTIPNTKEESLLNTHSPNSYLQMFEINSAIVSQNISEGRMVSNNGKFGIREGLFDHNGQVFHPRKNSKLRLKQNYTTLWGMNPIKIAKERMRIGERELISDCLDIFIHQITKMIAFSPIRGLLNGKMGIAILLFQYARFTNNQNMNEFAKNLLDIIIQETNLEDGKDFQSGLIGIAWGVNYLIKHGFIQPNESAFEEVDTVMFQHKSQIFNLFDFNQELEIGLYLLSRFSSCKVSEKDKWQLQLTKLIEIFHDYFTLKNINYKITHISCSKLILFFHLCQTLRKQGLNCLVIDAMYKELTEIVRISFFKEKKVSYKYILACLLADIPNFENCISYEDMPDSVTLTDVYNSYLHQMILERRFPIPEAVNKTILLIVKNQKRIYELLDLLNPYNLGLENYAGGFAWAMLKYLMGDEIVSSE